MGNETKGVEKSGSFLSYVYALQEITIPTTKIRHMAAYRYAPDLNSVPCGHYHKTISIAYNYDY